MGTMPCCLAEKAWSDDIGVRSWSAATAIGEPTPRAIVSINAKAKKLTRLACVVLLIADLLHPVHVPAVLVSRDGQMSHCGGGGRTVPVLDTGRARDDIAGADHLHRVAPLLGQADAGHDDQALPSRVRMPG